MPLPESWLLTLALRIHREAAFCGCPGCQEALGELEVEETSQWHTHREHYRLCSCGSCQFRAGRRALGTRSG